jgi:hypothetical protein
MTLFSSSSYSSAFLCSVVITISEIQVTKLYLCSVYVVKNPDCDFLFMGSRMIVADDSASLPLLSSDLFLNVVDVQQTTTFKFGINKTDRFKVY